VLVIAIGLPLVLFTDVFVQGALADKEKEDVVVIGNKSVPERSLSKTEIQNIFLGKKKRVDGTSITFVTLQGGPLHEIFLKKYLSRTPAQYKKYWKKMIFSGKAKTPKAFKTEQALIEHVEKTEGTIGYIDAETARKIESDRLSLFSIQ